MPDLTPRVRRYAARAPGGGATRATVAAVDEMSLPRSQPGESVGYIGANGAGKSTTIKMLTGILVPTVGLGPHLRPRAGAPAARPRPADRRGLRPAQSQLWWDLPLRESFTILAAIHQLDAGAAATPHGRAGRAAGDGASSSTPRCGSCRSASGCAPRSRRRCCTRPALLILDEPTIGLDVLSKQRLREFLRRTSAPSHGTTLLLTTHDMGDIERLCDRVLVVDHGRLAYDGTLPGLAATSARSGSWWSTWPRPPPTSPASPAHDTSRSEGEGPAPAAGVRRRGDDRRDGARRRSPPGVEVRDLSIEEPDIEDVVTRIYRSRR